MRKNIYKNLYNDQKNSGDLARSPRIKIMAKMINRFNPEKKNILDIGCHDGTFLSLVENRRNNFFGLDANSWAIEQSRKKGIDARQYFFDDESSLPYDDNFFDIIVAGEIIEHIFDTDFFLEEVRRVLKPQGKLLISTPNLASLGRRLFLFFGVSPLVELSPNEPGSVGHIRYFTFKTLKDLLKKHGFKTLLFQSDCVNFSKNGLTKSAHFAKLFPKFGASLIFLTENKK